MLVDDPGYFILFGGLKSFGAKIVGVPWNHDGPDTLAMETLIKEHHPKLFFTNTILHNPTGASLSHTRWDCKYHVVLIPKRRKQAIFGALRHLGEIFRELAVQRKCTVVLFAAKFVTAQHEAG